MKICLEVKNPGRAAKPAKDNIIIFDGKTWYITTKKDLFEEFELRLAKKEKELNERIAECNIKIAEVNKLKIDVAKQLLDFGEIITDLVSKEDK